MGLEIENDPRSGRGSTEPSDSIRFRCEDESEEFSVTFDDTGPIPGLVLEYADSRDEMFRTPTASGAKYAGTDYTFSSSEPGTSFVNYPGQEECFYNPTNYLCDGEPVGVYYNLTVKFHLK